MRKKFRRGKIYKDKDGTVVFAVIGFMPAPHTKDGVRMFLEGPRGFRCLVRKAGGKKMRERLFG